MKQYPQTWDILQQVLDDWTYTDFMHRPDFFRDDESNFARIYVFLSNPNSYIGKPGERVPRHTRHEWIVPCATYNYETWARKLYEFLKAISTHEVGEWFMIKGERLFAPHHGAGEDPYVEWQTRSDREYQVSLPPG